MKCEVCGNNPINNGPALYRVNKLGEIGIWRCWGCLTPEQKALQDPETVRLTKIIEEGK